MPKKLPNLGENRVEHVKSDLYCEKTYYEEFDKFTLSFLTFKLPEPTKHKAPIQSKVNNFSGTISRGFIAQ
jgi:hypothetical protein